MNTPSSPSTLSLASLLARLKPWQSRLLLLACAAVLTLAVRALLNPSLSLLEEQGGNLGWHLAPDAEIEERISVIAIDEKSLAEIGPWPWSREVMARLAQSLSDTGVQLQLYDMPFPEAREGDAAFVAALQATNAVVSQVPVLEQGTNVEGIENEVVQTGSLGYAANGLQCSNAPSAQSFIGNAAPFGNIAKGHITPVVDSDGAVRKVPAYICVDGAAYPALALSALLELTNAADRQMTVAPGVSVLDAGQVLTLANYPGLEVPLDSRGNMRVSFKKHPTAYRAFSATDVINGRIDRALLDNSLVLVGHTAFGLLDIVPTPYSGTAPGVELQARILGSVLDGSVPYTPRIASALLTLLAVGFAAVLFLLAGAREKVANYGLVGAGLVLPVLALLLHAQLLSAFNLWLGWMSPALFSVIAASAMILHEYARVRLERTRVLGNLSSYLPVDVAQEIAYALPNSSINAQRKDVTLLSADIRNFSAYGESRPPEESAALLHYFFMRTTEIIEKFHGHVHEFKGDSLLAIWNGSDAKSAARALQAALELQDTIQDVLPQHPPAGLEPLALGIGIEQGPVLIGSIGPAHRRSHTLLGETVTITLRIQEMTAELAHPVLVGECAARQLNDQGLISQGSYLLNGLRNPHILYAPTLPEPVVRTKHETPTLKVLRGGRH
jgi:adenylate cyclase